MHCMQPKSTAMHNTLKVTKLSFHIVLYPFYSIFSLLLSRPRRMHEVWINAVDNPVAWLSASLSVTRATVLFHSPDDATLIWPLLHYCRHLFE